MVVPFTLLAMDVAPKLSKCAVCQRKTLQLCIIFSGLYITVRKLNIFIIHMPSVSTQAVMVYANMPRIVIGLVAFLTHCNIGVIDTGGL